jgi:hypothetical protein
MGMKTFYHRHKLMILEAIILVLMLTVLWKVENGLISFICGTGAGLLFYRIGERIARTRIRKA